MGPLVHIGTRTYVREVVGVPLDDPQELLVDAPRLVRDLYGARATKGELSAVDLQVLVLLATNPDQRVVDLQKRLGMEVSSSVSHSVKALRDAGMITEEPVDYRRRSRALTAEGRAQVTDLTVRARELIDRHLAKPRG